MASEIEEHRGRGRPRKVQPTFSFKPPVYNSPLGYQYTQPIIFSVYTPPPVKPKKIQQQSHQENIEISFEPKIKRSAAIKGAQKIKRKKIIKEDETSSSVETEESESVEEDIYEKLLEKKENKFLVKFRNKSYLHCDYVDAEEIKKTRVGIMKIKRFKEIEIDPEYLKIDRIISEANLENNEHSFLIKWKKLPYENSTFEAYKDVKDCENFEKELQRFKERKKMKNMKFSLDYRPSKEKQIKHESSPVYKNKNKLRPYQLEGLNWLLNRWYFKQSCIMADEMGLGKTVQSVAFANALYKDFEFVVPILVVAPLSTICHWEREFSNWTDLRVLTYHGSIQGREIIFNYELVYKSGNINVRLFDVIITTYEMAMAGNHHLNIFEYGVGIFDEAHRLKNPNSKAALSLKNLTIHHKVLLSGTPIQNNLNELWALFNFIDPLRFNSLSSFLEEYKMQNSNDVEKLQNLLKPLMLRRMKEDVETSIPAKEETIIEVELTMIQKRYYRAILEKNLEFLTKGDRNNTPNLINAMMELRKCCIHPYLLKGAEQRIIEDFLNRKNENYNIDTMPLDLYYKVLIQSSGKLVLLDKLLVKLKGKHKVLIFSQMTKCLDLLAEYLNYRKFKYERIDGAVRGDLRQSAIDRFSTGDAFVFLLCTRAGGVGINLTAADIVVIFDSDWNPQNDLQAQARCHRIGQKNQVKIYRLITKNSYEREMFDKAGLKLGLDRAVLQRMNFNGEKKEKSLKKEDAVQLLLRKGAYGVLMETDEAADKFCEEDIEMILENRTKIIKHTEGGNVFSKATFQVEEEVEDPNFWDNLLSQKANEEREGRIKRQCRKLSRDNLFAFKKKLLDLFNFYTKKNKAMKIEAEQDQSFEIEPYKKILNKEEKDLFVLFLDILLNGLKNLDFDIFSENFADNKNLQRLGSIVKYCLDIINNEKVKMDFMAYLEKFNIEYDFELFEKMSDIYLKFSEPFLLRIQIPMIVNSLKDENFIIEKGRGFSAEDDRNIIKKIITQGYGEFKIKEKPLEEVNQRVRKIISVLYHKKEVKDNDNMFFKTILSFGRVTDKNLHNVESFLKRDTAKLKLLIDKICNMTRRARKDTPEADCYDRIVFFDKLKDLNDFTTTKRSSMPKGWDVKSDKELKEYLLTYGFINLYDKYKLNEDIVIKRFEQLFKNNISKDE